MKAFDVIVNHIHNFHVIVKDISIINSLLANISYGTYKIKAIISEILPNKADFVSKTKMIVGNMLEIINIRNEIKSNTKIIATISSVEKFPTTEIKSKNKIEVALYSRESISNELKSKLSIILDPTIGYFRKLVEFDSLTLSEIDSLSLDEMDYIVMMMSSDVNTDI